MDTSVVVSTAAPVAVVGGVLLMLNGALGGGLLAIVVKFVLDGLKKILPKKDWIKRFFPILATVLATVIWALYQFLTGQGTILSLLEMGLMGGLGAIGLHEVVNNSILGNNNPAVPTEAAAPTPVK